MPRKHLEDDLQKAVCQFLDAALPPDAFYFAVPNGGKRSRVEAARMKGMGVKAGVPDLCIVYRGKSHFIELKSPHGKLTIAQKTTMAALRKAGAEVSTSRSLGFIETLLSYWGIPLRARLAA